MLTLGPLEWPVDPSFTAAAAGVPDATWATLVQIAVDWLWGLTGRQFGQREATWRPETTPTPDSGLYPPPVDLYDTARYDLAAALGETPQPSTVLPLPPPVVAVVQVVIDGVILDPAAYRVEGQQIRRLDGDVWPATQNLALPATAAGTWQVAYQHGRVVPAGGQRAVGVLAAELAKRSLADKSCRLPLNVQTVTRNGTTVSLDAAGIMQGFTGIADCDQWVRTVNPRGLQGRPRVWSPDAASRRSVLL